MAVHGRYGQPCPAYGARVHLADRSLSRLLKQDWPRTLEEMEGLIDSSGTLSS